MYLCVSAYMYMLYIYINNPLCLRGLHTLPVITSGSNTSDLRSRLERSHPLRGGRKAGGPVSEEVSGGCTLEQFLRPSVSGPLLQTGHVLAVMRIRVIPEMFALSNNNNCYKKKTDCSVRA